MENLFFYLGKVILCSAVMFLYYRIFLKDKTFHHYNRFYLIGTLAVSLLLPLLKVDYFTIKLNTNIYQILSLLQNISPTNTTNDDFSISTIILAAVAVFSLLFLAKFSLALLKIRKLKNEFPQENFEGISFYMTNLENAPFSFFRNLFWKNSILLQSDLGKQILKHEMVHIEQKHSYDKLMIEILTAIFWFNPIFYLIKKEINLIHEYLADKKALKNSDTKAFAQMLLETHFSGKILPGTSPFLNSNLKKRIIMLKKSNTKFAYWRKVFALPLLFCLVFAYMVKAENREIEKQNLQIEELTKTASSEVSPLTKQDTISENSNLKYKANDQFVFEGKTVDQTTFEQKKSQFSQSKSHYFTSYNNFLSKELPVIFVGGKLKDVEGHDKVVGNIVAKIWDTPPAENIPTSENIPANITPENADERAIFLINSEMVTKAQFLKYQKENNGKGALSFSHGKQSDKDHWIFGEREQYGVFQISNIDQMGGHDAKKFHQLVKKVNPKWYFEQYINQKYTKRENERRKKLGLKENSFNQFLSENKVLSKTSENTTDNKYLDFFNSAIKDHNEYATRNRDIKNRMLEEIKNLNLKSSNKNNFYKNRDYNKNPLTKTETENLKKTAEYIENIRKNYSTDLEDIDKTFFGFKPELSYEIMYDINGIKVKENEVNNGNFLMFPIFSKNSEFYLNGKKVSKEKILKLSEDLYAVEDFFKKPPIIKTMKREMVTNGKSNYLMKLELFTQ